MLKVAAAYQLAGCETGPEIQGSHAGHLDTRDRLMKTRARRVLELWLYCLILHQSQLRLLLLQDYGKAVYLAVRRDGELIAPSSKQSAGREAFPYDPSYIGPQ